MDEVSQIDLAFCVDRTTSMTHLLEAARRHMLDILEALSATVGARLSVAVVAYQDYGGLDKPVLVNSFSADPGVSRSVLGRLQVVQNAANADAAEAVFAGLLACVDDLVWRPHAARLIVLLGDAPPHACGANVPPYADRFPQADPSGMTLMSMSARVETALVTLHALGMLPSPIPIHDRVTEECFGYLARSTGGTYRTARSPADALALVEEIGRREFGQLEFDRRLWSLLHEKQSGTVVAVPQTQLPELEREWGVSLYQVHAGIHRLRKRGLVEPTEDEGNNQKH